MRIAFSADSGEGLNSPISSHFGRSPYYVIVDLDEKNTVTQVKSIENAHAENHDPGQMPAFIKEQGADVMISGGMGGRAVEFFHQYGIKVATGASGTVQESLSRYLDGKLYGDAPCADSVEHGH